MKPIRHFIFSAPIRLLLLHMNTCLVIRATTTPQILHEGFSATPDSSISSFQSLLADPTGDFSFGFLRVNRSKLALAVVHVPSSEPVWLANVASNSVQWSKSTRLFFNGSLVLSDPRDGIYWSTHHSIDGDRLLLMNNSNLQIQKLDQNASSVVVWQSFDHPFDTLMETQNFTVNMSLVSSNLMFSMKLGSDFLGLYTNLRGNSNQIYWKHTAMEAKAEIVVGEGPIYARISSNGFLGTYQNEEKAPVDVLPFDTFQRLVAGIRRLRLESDGNLKGYFWNGSIWVLDFRAITEDCELPSSCGQYGLCRPGKGCECLDNNTEYRSGECFPAESGDFCDGQQELRNGYWILRRVGVDLPYKELMRFQKMDSLGECEGSCERNCSCWGSVYNNVSGYCYELNFPVDTLVGVGDERKLGYFKVRREMGKKRHLGYAAGVSLLVGTVIVVVGVVVVGSWRIWVRRRRRERRFLEDETCPGPYKDLGSASFRSIELCKS